MAVVIYRCRKCDKSGRVEYRKELRPIGYGRKEAVYFRVSDGRRHIQLEECCGAVMKWGLLKAWHKADVKCDARCEEAKGFSCECSCGGENHGKAGGLFSGLMVA